MCTGEHTLDLGTLGTQSIDLMLSLWSIVRKVKYPFFISFDSMCTSSRNSTAGTGTVWYFLFRLVHWPTLIPIVTCNWIQIKVQQVLVQYASFYYSCILSMTFTTGTE